MKYILSIQGQETVFDDWNTVLQAGINRQNYSCCVIIFNDKNDVLVTFHKLLLHSDANGQKDIQDLNKLLKLKDKY